MKGALVAVTLQLKHLNITSLLLCLSPVTASTVKTCMYACVCAGKSQGGGSFPYKYLQSVYALSIDQWLCVEMLLLANPVLCDAYCITHPLAIAIAREILFYFFKH